MDKRYIKPNGSTVWVHTIVAPLTLAKDQQDLYICLVWDITERKAVEKALQESERINRFSFSHLPGLGLQVQLRSALDNAVCVRRLL